MLGKVMGRLLPGGKETAGAAVELWSSRFSEKL